jgi:hypothetical protein
MLLAEGVELGRENVDGQLEGLDGIDTAGMSHSLAPETDDLIGAIVVAVGCIRKRAWRANSDANVKVRVPLDAQATLRDHRPELNLHRDPTPLGSLLSVEHRDNLQAELAGPVLWYSRAPLVRFIPLFYGTPYPC